MGLIRISAPTTDQIDRASVLASDLLEVLRIEHAKARDGGGGPPGGYGGYQPAQPVDYSAWYAVSSERTQRQAVLIGRRRRRATGHLVNLASPLRLARPHRAARCPSRARRRTSSMRRTGQRTATTSTTHSVSTRSDLRWDVVLTWCLPVQAWQASQYGQQGQPTV